MVQDRLPATRNYTTLTLALGAVPAISTKLVLCTPRRRSSEARFWLQVASSSILYLTSPTVRKSTTHRAVRGATPPPSISHVVSTRQLCYKTARSWPQAAAVSTLQIRPSCTTLVPIQSTTLSFSSRSSTSTFLGACLTAPDSPTGLVR